MTGPLGVILRMTISFQAERKPVWDDLGEAVNPLLGAGGRVGAGRGGDQVFTVSDEVQLCGSVGSSQWLPKTQKGKTGGI